MFEYVALAAVRPLTSDALSAQPWAPVVDDRPRRRARAAAAATLRSAASVEHRWAERLDPAVRRAAPARG
jgi:hypothetical protein